METLRRQAEEKEYQSMLVDKRMVFSDGSLDISIKKELDQASQEISLITNGIISMAAIAGVLWYWFSNYPPGTVCI